MKDYGGQCLVTSIISEFFGWMMYAISNPVITTTDTGLSFSGNMLGLMAVTFIVFGLPFLLMAVAEFVAAWVNSLWNKVFK